MKAYELIEHSKRLLKGTVGWIPSEKEFREAEKDFERICELAEMAQAFKLAIDSEVEVKTALGYYLVVADKPQELMEWYDAYKEDTNEN